MTACISLGAPRPVRADTTADRVYGQPDFVSLSPNQPIGLPDADNLALSNAAHVAVAQDGRLWASDPDNNRVLSWPPGAASGAPADWVLGQPDFATNSPNNGGVSGASFFLPQGLAIDAAGNLWVTDAFNHRVIRFNNPFTDATPTTADLVIGQHDLSGNLENLGLGGSGPAVALPDSLQFPGRVLVREPDVFVADSGNSRVLHYTLPFGNKPFADRVYGQYGDFTRRAKNNDGLGNNNPCCPSADNLYNPIGIALDATGRLYVADWNNHRILRFDPGDTTADAVFGQSDYLSRIPDSGGLLSGLTLPIDLAIDPLGRLFAADSANHRVLVWNVPPAPGAPDFVFGQFGDAQADAPNHGLGFFATDADGLSGPTGLALGPAGDLFVADTNNQRVLRFIAPLAPSAGDVNCDGNVDPADAAALVVAMLDPAQYASQFPGCSGDVNGDAATDGRDAQALIGLLN